MSIIVPGVPSSRATPGIYFNVVLGGPGTSSGAAPLKTVLLGNARLTAITGSAPTFTVAAGTATVATPYFVASSDDAATYFGRGSELHRMALATFSQYPDATLYACAVADAAGTAASGVLTFATNANAAFTVRLRLCGNVIDVAVASGDTPTVIATAVTRAILAVPDLPYTAQFSVGAVIFTAKQTGPRGNAVVVDAYFIAAGASIETRITTGSTSSGAGTTGIWSGTATLGAEITLGSGATQDTFADALTAIEPTKYDHIVGACFESDNLGRIVTHINAQAGPTVQLLEQADVCFTGIYDDAVTLATGQNASRLQIAWHLASVLPPPDVAAQVSAARLTGEAFIGVPNALPGEADDPVANLNGCNLATVLMQRAAVDRPLATEIEGALNNGLTPIGESGERPGYGAIVRSVTSRSLSSGQQNYAVRDTSIVTGADYTATYIRAALLTAYRGMKLGTDLPNGNPASRAPRIVTPSMIRSFVYAQLVLLEQRGILRDVAANAALLVVEADTVVPGRVNMEIPAEMVPGLNVGAGNVRQLTAV